MHHDTQIHYQLLWFFMHWILSLQLERRWPLLSSFTNGKLYFKWPEPHHLERGREPCLLTNTFPTNSCSIASNIVIEGKASLKSSRIHLPWVIECKPWLCKHFQKKVIVCGINFHSWLNNACWPSELGENPIYLVRDWPDWWRKIGRSYRINPFT